MLIDTHCHLDFSPLSDQLDLHLEEARRNGITQWVVPAVCPDNWMKIADICQGNHGLYPAFGIHPRHTAEVQPEHLKQLDAIARQGVAIGEIGLDGLYGNLDQQSMLFREQLRIARRHALPVLVHCRNAIGRVIEILRQEGAAEYGGIMHAFSGSVESARDCIKLGFAISLTGTLTRPDAVRPLRLARELPLSHLVVETDAPDLTPATRLPAFNRPAWLLDVVEALAKARDCSLLDIAEATSATTRKLLPKL